LPLSFSVGLPIKGEVLPPSKPLYYISWKSIVLIPFMKENVGPYKVPWLLYKGPTQIEMA